jgi:hypothetical protein
MAKIVLVAVLALVALQVSPIEIHNNVSTVFDRFLMFSGSRGQAQGQGYPREVRSGGIGRQHPNPGQQRDPNPGDQGTARLKEDRRSVEHQHPEPRQPRPGDRRQAENRGTGEFVWGNPVMTRSLAGQSPPRRGRQRHQAGPGEAEPDGRPAAASRRSRGHSQGQGAEEEPR